MDPSPNIPIDQLGRVDLRSDTVTRPTPEMFDAMRSAPLGDDVLGDDPTVAALEALAAEMASKDAAVFVPSGTMGNEIAIASHVEVGDAILCDEDSHIVYYEGASPALMGHALTLTLPTVRGVMDPNEVERRVIKRSLMSPATTLLSVENTHNRAGGAIVPLEVLSAYRVIADHHGMRIHLDGARVFHAAVALGVPLSELTAFSDSATFCLSKGLRSPIGSVLCGSHEFIEKARIWRKRIGGGMRQAGVLAACGMVSLTKMIERLADDHARAKQTAQALIEVPGLSIDLESVQTNMVLIDTDRPSSIWLDALRDCNIWALPPAPNRIRLVFHADIDYDCVARTIEAFRTVSRQLGA